MRIVLSLFLLASSSIASADQWVNGYTRKDGTHVNGYNRTDANNTKNDNYSTVGNVNPYTGKAGTKARDYGSTNTDSGEAAANEE